MKSMPHPRGKHESDQLRPFLLNWSEHSVSFSSEQDPCHDVYTRGALGLIGVAIAHGLMLSVLVSPSWRRRGGQLNPRSLSDWSFAKTRYQNAGFN